MSWHLYVLTFKLKSPLHVGFHKVMHFSRTRAYVPAKTFWGALTAQLTRYLRRSDYIEIGENLKRVVRFGYFYLSKKSSNGEEKVFIPNYTNEGLRFGDMPQKRCFACQYELG